MLDNCQLCPRKCSINRQEEIGFCKEPMLIKLAKVALHYGEEPVISGSNGSATFFFSSCTLKCPFCQNWQISHFGYGSIINITELANLMLKAQRLKANNINLVSATHYMPLIEKSIIIAREKGLNLPIVYNTGGYESEQTLDRYQSMIDIYLPDLKTLNHENAIKLYLAKDYASQATNSILFMADKKPLIYKKDILMQGVIVRHLVLPNHLDETYDVLKFFSKNLKNRALLSLMTQYTPVYIPNEKRSIPDRFLDKTEYDMLCAMLDEFDIEDGFLQDLDTSQDWLPNFHNINSFDHKLAKTIWHNGQNII